MVAQAGGVLLVLRGVTTMATAVQMKTDFVANASHELRMLIAAIKIAFETLGEVYQEDPEQTQRCIGIIDGHIKRLEDMPSAHLLDRRASRARKPSRIFRRSRPEKFSRPSARCWRRAARQKSLSLNFQGDDQFAFPSDRRLINLVRREI